MPSYEVATPLDEDPQYVVPGSPHAAGAQAEFQGLQANTAYESALLQGGGRQTAASRQGREEDGYIQIATQETLA